MRVLVHGSCVVLLLLIGGCARADYQGSFDCKGKGTLSGQGGPYAGSVMFDCGPGASIRRKSHYEAIPLEPSPPTGVIIESPKEPTK